MTFVPGMRGLSAVNTQTIVCFFHKVLVIMYADDGLDVRPKLVTEEQCDCVVQECTINMFIDCSATEMCYLKIIRKLASFLFK
jgi:hypothetical protein